QREARYGRHKQLLRAVALAASGLVCLGGRLLRTPLAALAAAAVCAAGRPRQLGRRCGGGGRCARLAAAAAYTGAVARGVALPRGLQGRARVSVPLPAPLGRRRGSRRD